MTAPVAQNKQSFMKTGHQEYIKQYLAYDGSDRLQYVYEARANAQHGEYALKTTYTYVTGTNRVQKVKEEDSTWDSTYDI